MGDVYESLFKRNDELWAKATRRAEACRQAGSFGAAAGWEMEEERAANLDAYLLRRRVREMRRRCPAM